MPACFPCAGRQKPLGAAGSTDTFRTEVGRWRSEAAHGRLAATVPQDLETILRAEAWDAVVHATPFLSFADVVTVPVRHGRSAPCDSDMLIDDSDRKF
ncbi:MAG: hypothetical protein D6725_05775 [Planctomycetota bacterium]|nr:MAG: hypothetical protein D6725_05775 [Planctomycetota bacterium]